MRSLIFYRAGYFEVIVSTNSEDDVCYLEFRTTTKVEQKKFEKFPRIPKVLDEILPAQASSWVVLPDYESYLVRAMVLHEDIMKPFLSILKNHLKQVQVALGEIEGWLLEPVQTLNWINEKFETNLEPPAVVSDGDTTSGYDLCVVKQGKTMRLLFRGRGPVASAAVDPTFGYVQGY